MATLKYLLVLMLRYLLVMLRYLLVMLEYLLVLLRYLLTPQARPHSINDIMPMIGARFYSQLEATHLRNDLLENELSKVSLELFIHFL